MDRGQPGGYRRRGQDTTRLGDTLAKAAAFEPAVPRALAAPLLDSCGSGTPGAAPRSSGC